MNPTPPAPRRWSTRKKIVVIIVVTLAVLLLTCGGCLIVLGPKIHMGSLRRIRTQRLATESENPAPQSAHRPFTACASAPQPAPAPRRTSPA
jgi:flagellar basal body-associated protein FliL